MRIAIVGAGLSGLATAFYVQRARPDWELTIFESDPAAGGTMQTVSVDGFRFEAGGNGFLTNKPDSLRLVEDSGAKDLLQPSSDMARPQRIPIGQCGSVSNATDPRHHPIDELDLAGTHTVEVRASSEPCVEERKKLRLQHGIVQLVAYRLVHRFGPT